MLRTLKWVYSLGVRHERQRIASHLQLEATQARNENDAIYDVMREKSERNTKVQNKKRLELQTAVNNRVADIISDMFRSNDNWIAGPSFMFPDEKDKK